MILLKKRYKNDKFKKNPIKIVIVSILTAFIMAMFGFYAVPVQAAIDTNNLIGNIYSTSQSTGGVTPVAGSYQTYSYTFTATEASTSISLLFRHDPAFFSLDNISVTLTAGGGELITNGSFAQVYSNNGTDYPKNWALIGTQGLSAAGNIASGVWYDGAVGGFDGIQQNIVTTPGGQYRITFDLKADSWLNVQANSTSPETGSITQVLVYAGGIPAGFEVTEPEDNTPPTAPSINFSNGYTADTWTSSNVSFTVEGSTDTGSGMKGYAYSIDGGAYVAGTSGSITSAGTYTVRGRAEDNAGNFSYSSLLTVKIDKTAPSQPSVTLLNGYNEDTWTGSDVSFSVSGSTDSESGINHYEYSIGGAWNSGASATINSTGTYTVTGRAVDNAGNVSGTGTGKSVKIDKTGPSAFSNFAVTATSTSELGLSGTTTDAHSGMNAAPYAFYNGTAWGSWGTDSGTVLGGYTPNQRITVQMRAQDAVGNITNSSSISKYTLAAVPEIISAVSKQNGSVILTINENNNPDITSYYVEKATDENFTDADQAMDWTNPTGNTLTIPKSKLASATTYYFRIRAINGDGTVTSYSSTNPSALTVPEIPVISSVTPQFDPDGYGIKQMKIDWNTVSGATSYDIFDGNGNFITSVPGGTTTYTHKTNLSSSGGLVPNTQYSYKVVSRNAGTPGTYDDGCSVYSGTLSDVTLATVPDADEMKALANGNLTLKVEEYDNPDTTVYYVQKSTDPAFSNASQALDWTNPGNDHLLTITGLSRGTTYYFRIKAKNSHNDETAYGSVMGSISTIPADLGSAPTVSVASASQLNISWSSVTGATSYDLYYSDGTFFKNVTGTSTSETGLEPNTLRRYYIKGKSSSGISLVQSPTSAAKYTLAVKPDLTLVPQANGDILVEIDGKGNTSATQYYVEYDTSNDFSGAANSAYATATSRTVTGLLKGTTYYFRVKAKNGNDTETTYSTGKSTMTALEVPVINAGTPSVIGTNHKNSIEWSAITGAVNYKIYRDGVLLGTTSGTSYTDPDLKANKVYTYTMTAVNAAGESLKSTGYPVRTLAEYPAEVTASDKTVNSFRINLTPDSLVAESQKYRLIIKKSSDQSTVRSLSWSSDLSYNITALEAGVEYEVYIDVRNSDNVARGEQKLLTLYCNRPVDGAITNDEDRLYGNSLQNKFEIKLKVWDPDADMVTISATIAGLTRTVHVSAPTTEPGAAIATLSWDIYSLPENTYTNIPVTITDGNDSTITRTYTKTLTVDKTAPAITVSGSATMILETNDLYVEPGVSVTGDDGNGVELSGADFDTSVTGNYTITYTAADDAGNTSVKTRKVAIVEGVSAQALNLVIPAEGIEKNSAILQGGISTLGRDQGFTDYGFAYGTASFNAIDEAGVTCLSLGTKNDLNAFITSISGLDPDTAYVVRTYVRKQDNSVILSDEESFTTLPADNTDNSTNVYFTTEAYRVNEGGSVTLRVERSGDLTGETWVDCVLGAGTAGAGTDFTDDLSSDTMIFAAGESTKTFEVQTVADNDYEADETVIYTLINVVSGSAIVCNTATITILNDDAKTLSSDNAVSAFELGGYTASIDAAADIDSGAYFIRLSVPYGTSLSNMIPELTIPDGAHLSPAINTARDFSVPIAYTVTAEDGISVRRYIVAVTVLPQSGTNTLDSIQVENESGEPQTMTPSFSSDTTEYEINVGAETDTINLDYVKSIADASVVVKINGNVDNTPDSINLLTGANTVTIEVTAPNGSKKIYTIAVTRAPQATDSNNNLVSITINNGTLSPAFNQSIIDYTVNVPNTTSTMSVTPTLSNPNASYVIIANGHAVSSGASVALNTGANVFAITVTATDGTTKTYAISVSRGEVISGGTGSNGTGNGGYSGGSGSGGNTTNNEDTDKGKIVKDKLQDPDAPLTNLNSSLDNLKDDLFTKDELKQIETGIEAKVILKVTDISATVSVEDKKKIEEKLDKEATVLYIDLSLYKKIGDGDESRITQTKDKISISITVPEDLRSNDSKINRTYRIVRIHDGVAELIDGTYDPMTHLFTFETDRFSTYALTFKDNEAKEASENNPDADGNQNSIHVINDFYHLSLTASTAANTQKLSYNKVEGADGYLIYGAVCISGIDMVKLADVSSKTTSYDHTGLKWATYYKYQVKAYKIINGKKVVIATSKIIHSVTTSKVFANPIKITSKTLSVSLKAGATKQLDCQLVLEKGKKIEYHTSAVRFESTDKAIATVSSDGKITAKAKGTCYVYAYAQNGVYVKIKVSVK